MVLLPPVLGQLVPYRGKVRFCTGVSPVALQHSVLILSVRCAWISLHCFTLFYFQISFVREDQMSVCNRPKLTQEALSQRGNLNPALSS